MDSSQFWPFPPLTFFGRSTYSSKQPTGELPLVGQPAPASFPRPESCSQAAPAWGRVWPWHRSWVPAVFLSAQRAWALYVGCDFLYPTLLNHFAEDEALGLPKTKCNAFQRAAPQHWVTDPRLLRPLVWKHSSPALLLWGLSEHTGCPSLQGCFLFLGPHGTQKLDLQALSVILVVQGSENGEHTGCCLWENDLLHLLLLWRWGWLAAQVRGSILESRWAVTCLVLISPSFPSVLTKVITLLPWTCHYWICSLCLRSPVPLRPYKNKVTRWKKHGGPVRKQMLEAVLKQNSHSFIIHSSIHPFVHPSIHQSIHLSKFFLKCVQCAQNHVNCSKYRCNSSV